MTHFRSSPSPLFRLLLAAAGMLLSVSAWAIVTDLGNVSNVHSPAAAHVEQVELNGLPAPQRFVEAFEVGDELFATAFNALDGGGANVGRGQRYTRVPRADLRGRGEWYTHTPIRVTGPNAGGCFECHEQPFEDGAGTAALNVHRDPHREPVGCGIHGALHARRPCDDPGRSDPRARGFQQRHGQ